MLSWAIVFLLCTFVAGLILLLGMKGPSTLVAGALFIIFLTLSLLLVLVKAFRYLQRVK